MNTEEIEQKKALYTQQAAEAKDEKKRTLDNINRKEICLNEAKKDMGTLFELLIMSMVILFVLIVFPYIMYKVLPLLGICWAILIWVPTLSFTVGVRFLAWCRMRKDKSCQNK